MPRDFLIAIGGTGSRCLESIVYLAAAGLFRNQVQVLIIDPDQNNGNSVRARQIISDYDILHMAAQPKNPERKRLVGSSKLDPPVLFQAAINRQGDRSGSQLPVFWNNPNTADRTFKQLIDYQSQDERLRDFLDLFYEPADLNMILDVGYRGRTNVGSVALKQDLENTLEVSGGALHRFLERLNTDLQSGEARVFVVGSVFGGTGAAGLPTIPSLIKNLSEDIISKANREKLRYGCAMMTPYFSFPKGSSFNSGPGTDSAGHAVATQAALHHYAHVPPGYQHVYLIGAPARPQTSDSNIVGGENQTNRPHYAEMVAALAAWDFFALKSIAPDGRALHFVDTLDKGTDLGVCWETLPVHPHMAGRREELKRRMVSFTTFAYFYKNFLYGDLLSQRSYRDSNWYKNNFTTLNLDQEGDKLAALFKFVNSYLGWLYQVGATGQAANPQLFNWEALREQSRELSAQYLGNLMAGATVRPKYMNDGYDKILDKLDKLKLKQAGTDSSAGLLIYLVHEAVAEFCKENYAWQES